MAAPVLDEAPAPALRPAGRAARLRRRPGRLALTRAALAAGSGLALALAFPPFGLAPLAPLAVAGLAGACRGGRASTGALAGGWAGLVFFAVLLSWLRVIGPDAWLLLAAVQAAFLAALGVGLTLVQRLPGWPAWVAALWVGEELVRDRVPLGGFPWGRLGFSQAGTPYAGLAALGGVPLVSFAVALTGALLLAVIVALREHRVRRGALVALAGLAVAVGGLLVPLPTAGESGGGAASAVVGVVQGNVPRTGLDAFGQRAAVLGNSVAETRRLAAAAGAGRVPRPQLVIWPENASDLDPFVDPGARVAIDGAVAAVGVPVLVGAVLDAGPQRVANTGLVWDPVRGPGARYVKRHPVPFGEYVPWRDVLDRYIGRLALVPRDFVAGTRPGLLSVGPARLGDVICFEVAYDGLVRDVVRAGGRLLVVQTNNATYGRTGETEQQLAMSRLRAVEHGRAVLVAATSGVSAIIGPDGSVRARTAEFTAAALVQPVPLRDSRTLADRVGAAPEWALGVLGLAAVLAGAWRGRRRVRG